MCVKVLQESTDEIYQKILKNEHNNQSEEAVQSNVRRPRALDNAIRDRMYLMTETEMSECPKIEKKIMRDPI